MVCGVRVVPPLSGSFFWHFSDSASSTVYFISTRLESVGMKCLLPVGKDRSVHLSPFSLCSIVLVRGQDSYCTRVMLVGSLKLQAGWFSLLLDLLVDIPWDCLHGDSFSLLALLSSIPQVPRDPSASSLPALLSSVPLVPRNLAASHVESLQCPFEANRVFVQDY